MALVYCILIRKANNLDILHPSPLNKVDRHSAIISTECYILHRMAANYLMHCDKLLYFCTAAYAWGILIFESLYALNTVTGGDLQSTIKCRRFRLMAALMVRESREVRKVI